MKERPEVDKMVEEGLDQISSAGEYFGKSVGSAGRSVQKILVGAGVLLIFGIAAFLWAFAQGMFKKK
jgi:hypothetical protein